MESAEIQAHTREWLNKQFSENWEKNGGPAQTRHFMERLLAGLSTSETSYLKSCAATLLDWGCAMGDGVEILGQAFPKCDVAGLDVALVAIEAARRRFPARRFCLSEQGEIVGRFDVIVTSNCLEHFEDPWGLFKAHLAACNDFYVALVPYAEFPRIDGHLATFNIGSFPECAGGFVRLCERVLPTDATVWHGGQLLVVYGSQSYLSQREETQGGIPDFWPTYFDALPPVREALDRMAAITAAAETRRGEMLAERDDFVRRLGHLGERERAIVYLEREVGRRDDAITLHSERLAALEAELVRTAAPYPVADR